MHCRGVTVLRLFLPLNVGAMVDIKFVLPLITVFVAAILILAPCWRGGKLFMVGSLAGYGSFAGAATYSGTKAAYVHFAYAFADEMRWYSGIHGWRGSLLGPIDTGFIMDEIDKVERYRPFPKPMSQC